MSQNRIRELSRESFNELTDLRFLYLFDNMINRVEDATFTHLTSLEALDLSGNALTAVPLEIFNLPLLRNLYIADNGLRDRGFEDIPKPIKAPLKILNIANNRLTKMPDFGILPDLYQLNISSNDLYDLTPQQFSPFCHIKEVDLNKTSMKPCLCESVTRFLTRKREVYLLSPLYCDTNSVECKIDPNVTLAESPDFYECMSIRRAVIEDKQAKITWTVVALAVVAFLVFFIGCLYCLHRRNVRQMHSRAKINNPNVSVIHAKPNLEPAEAADDQVGNPQKLLITKRSDV